MDIFKIILLITLPIISAMIGWLTNFFAIKMLFRPLKPIQFLGLRFQGLLPKRQAELAQKISVSISEEFFTTKDLSEIVAKIDLNTFLKSYLSQKWDENIGEFLQSIPMASMFLSDDKLHDIKEAIMGKFSFGSQAVSDLLQSQPNLKQHIQQQIEKNILAFDVSQIEDIISSVARREFKHIEKLGAMIGFVVGMLQVLLVLFMGEFA